MAWQMQPGLASVLDFVRSNSTAARSLGIFLDYISCPEISWDGCRHMGQCSPVNIGDQFGLVVQSSGSLDSSSDSNTYVLIRVQLHRERQPSFGNICDVWNILWLCSWAVTESQSIMSLQPVVSGENCSEGKIKRVYSPSSSVLRLYCKDLHNCIVMYITGRVAIGLFDILGLDPTSADVFGSILSLKVGI